MALSSVTIIADGSTDVFTFSFAYLSTAHISAYKNGVLVSGATFPTSSSVKLNTAVSNGDTIVVQRVTPRDALTVLIPNSGTFRGKDINAQSLQTLYIAQEAFDSLTTIVQLDTTDNTMDALGKRIKNVADPVNDQDAATKKWAETAMSSQLAQAITARTTAQAAATSATADKNTVAADKAIVAADKATVAADKALVAADKALVAADKATVIANATTVLADKNTVAADKAIVAADKATVAADKALTLGYKNDTAALLDIFGDAFLGSKASDPSVDNDGNALQDGAIYWNSTAKKLRAYDLATTTWYNGLDTSVSVPATSIAFTPSGNIAATNAQTAIQELDSEKLAASAYTAADVLTKIKTVDGAGSGLDADTLDGMSSAAFAPASHNHDSRYYTEAEVDALLAGVGGVTVLASGSVSGTPGTLDFSGTFSDYKKLELVLVDGSHTNGAATSLNFRCSQDDGSTFLTVNLALHSNNAGAFNGVESIGNNPALYNTTFSAAIADVFSLIEIWNPGSSGNKRIHTETGKNGTTEVIAVGGGYVSSNGALNLLRLNWAAGNFDAGTYYLIGYK